MKTYTFRSILTENIERVVPGTVFSKMELDFNESTSAQHKLELSLKEILTDRAWRAGLAIAIMVCFGVFGLSYGILLIAMKKALAGPSGATIKFIFFSSAFVTCALLWFAVTMRIGVKNRKRDMVEKERGKGNWRIVDEKDWEDFLRLVNASKKSRGK